MEGNGAEILGLLEPWARLYQGISPVKDALSMGNVLFLAKMVEELRSQQELLWKDLAAAIGWDYATLKRKLDGFFKSGFHSQELVALGDALEVDYRTLLPTLCQSVRESVVVFSQGILTKYRICPFREGLTPNEAEAYAEYYTRLWPTGPNESNLDAATPLDIGVVEQVADSDIGNKFEREEVAKVIVKVAKAINPYLVLAKYGSLPEQVRTGDEGSATHNILEK